MAVKTALRRAARLLLAGLRDYAAAKGLARDDYRLFVALHARSTRVQIVFAVRAFPAPTRFDTWDEARTFLAENVPGGPELLRLLNLSVITFARNDQGGLYEIPPDFVEVDEL